MVGKNFDQVETRNKLLEGLESQIGCGDTILLELDVNTIVVSCINWIIGNPRIIRFSPEYQGLVVTFSSGSGGCIIEEAALIVHMSSILHIS